MPLLRAASHVAMTTDMVFPSDTEQQQRSLYHARCRLQEREELVQRRAIVGLLLAFCRAWFPLVALF